ncbi:hypothetical protein PGIGA_G00179310 [Pangasianodon gigas]|uniref:Uncharacterized protein n=1 Tax=Pangasianodon gigas TaxID=30993 RepID=A0ACC5XWR1_PANGG|nr:hypothetical protein [Pangasianodon gigas]
MRVFLMETTKQFFSRKRPSLHHSIPVGGSKYAITSTPRVKEEESLEDTAHAQSVYILQAARGNVGVQRKDVC